MSTLIPLSELPLNRKAKVAFIKSNISTKRRMLDLGLIKNTIVEALYLSPSKDPKAYYFRGTVIALRSEEACNILVYLQPKGEK